MAAEIWEEEGEKPLLEYVQEIKSQLQMVWEDIRSQMERAQSKQKSYYDQGAKARQLQPNDKVLILRPSSESKLLAKWQGPYTVLKPVSPVTYLIELSKNPKRVQIYHINLLKKWVEPTMSVTAAATGFMVTPEKPLDIELCPTNPDTSSERPQVNPDIPEPQQRQLDCLLAQHTSFFSGKPGKTTLIQHHIRTPEGQTVRPGPYRIPEARRHLIEKEIKTML
ncbi:hypothetical protein NDU88_011125 [Pleurodeles waltl]|uniref:Integrase p58-like C-terminal domain-containing protein n=1 Tax=Pleurodeles waltl TaxID=8319 RepID=A0AAV7QWC0_PLEWA|nr:hypothetical protein NDU88_011125 [Pleurodeles waltl]